MNYWEAILDEVLHKDDESRPFLFTDIGRDLLRKKQRRRVVRAALKKLQLFPLSGQFEGLHLTKREGECLYYFSKGRTIPEAAAAMSLSPRTVEFYLKNMKLKLGIDTKAELVEIMAGTDVLRELTFAFGKQDMTE